MVKNVSEFHLVEIFGTAPNLNITENVFIYFWDIDFKFVTQLI